MTKENAARGVAFQATWLLRHSCRSKFGRHSCRPLVFQAARVPPEHSATGVSLLRDVGFQPTRWRTACLRVTRKHGFQGELGQARGWLEANTTVWQAAFRWLAQRPHRLLASRTFIALLGIAVLSAPAVAETGDQKASPIDSLDQSALQETFRLLRQNYIQRDQLTLENLNRAALAGLLERLDFGAELVARDAEDAPDAGHDQARRLTM